MLMLVLVRCCLVVLGEVCGCVAGEFWVFG